MRINQSDDGFRSGCQSVSQHQQQSFSRLHYKPGRSLKPHKLAYTRAVTCYSALRMIGKLVYTRAITCYACLVNWFIHVQSRVTHVW